MRMALLVKHVKTEHLLFSSPGSSFDNVFLQAILDVFHHSLVQLDIQQR